MNGWLDNKHEVIHKLQLCISFLDEMSTQDALIFTGERVIVHVSLCSELKTVDHPPHGGNNCQKRAREFLLRDMTGGINNFIFTCKNMWNVRKCRPVQNSSSINFFSTKGKSESWPLWTWRQRPHGECRLLQHLHGGWSTGKYQTYHHHQKALGLR